MFACEIIRVPTLMSMMRFALCESGGMEWCVLRICRFLIDGLASAGPSPGAPSVTSLCAILLLSELVLLRGGSVSSGSQMQASIGSIAASWPVNSHLYACFPHGCVLEFALAVLTETNFVIPTQY